VANPEDWGQEELDGVLCCIKSTTVMPQGHDDLETHFLLELTKRTC